MSLIILEAVADGGEELAMKAADELGIPVGWDSEFQSATFDSDELDEEGLLAVLTQKLNGLDPDWQQKLTVVED